MKCSRLFLEVTFFGVFFGQVWGNLGKNYSHPQKFACSYTYEWAPYSEVFPSWLKPLVTLLHMIHNQHWNYPFHFLCNPL